MSDLAKAFVSREWVADPARQRPREHTAATGGVSSGSVGDEQICWLVQQLFFRSPEPLIRHVAFAAAEPENEVAELCLQAARAVAQGGLTVGLIDAAASSSPLEFHIGRGDGDEAKGHESEKGLRLVSRREWLDQDGDDGAVSPACLVRLHRLCVQFDFSILYCGAMSFLAATIARTCDGLVLVLTANRTRRVVAERMKEQLKTAGVRLLGTVLAGRHFPIPAGLYRKL